MLLEVLKQNAIKQIPEFIGRIMLYNTPSSHCASMAVSISSLVKKIKKLKKKKKSEG
jgi:hypothetical protein